MWHIAQKIPLFSVKEYLNDQSPIPEDIISPRVLTQKGLLVFGGPPKVGKSDFLISWLNHVAAGNSFLGMTSSRPMKILCLQTEIEREYMKERLQELKLDKEHIGASNLIITPKVQLSFNSEEISEIKNSLNERCFRPDIIAIDSLLNICNSNSNDNSSALLSLQKTLEKLRNAINPNAGIMLTYQTKKLSKTMLEEDPFQGFSGLRGFHDTEIIMFKQDEENDKEKNKNVHQIVFELRNGKDIPSKLVCKVDGRWQVLK